MENTQKTMTQVLWNKMIDLVDNTELRDIAKFGTLSFFAGIMSSFFCDGGEMMMKVMQYNHHMVPNIILTCTAVFSFPWIFRKATIAFSDALDFFKKEEDEIESEIGTVEGIPLDELLDHLFTSKTFKRDDIEGRFKIPRYKYTLLSKRLKDAGVLTHGLNNTTVLADGMTREHVASVLTGEGEQINIVRPDQSPTLPSSFVKRMISTFPQEQAVQAMCN